VRAPALLFGELVLVWPGVTVLALALVFAVYAVLDGIGMVASGLGGGPDRGGVVLRPSPGVSGSPAASSRRHHGVIAASWPAVTGLVLILVVGAWAVVTGVLESAAAVRLRREVPGRRVLAIAGVVSLIAGVIILARPALGAVVVRIGRGMSSPG
jgi:uncharacterized membrane protein HdeD (DUF308 family)